MEFHNWQTFIDEYRRIKAHELKHHPMTDIDILAKEAGYISKHPFKDEWTRIHRLSRLVAEQNWIESGRPYYKIHPLMVKELCKTNLESIPAEFIEIPNNFKSVCFRFAEDVPLRDAQPIDGMTLTIAPEMANSDLYIRTVLFGKVRVEDDLLGRIPKQYLNVEQFFLYIDEGFRQKFGQFDRSLCNFVSLVAKPGQTIPEAIEWNLGDRCTGNSIVMLSMGKRLLNLFRVIISAGFLANTPEGNLVVPDILSIDRAAFDEAERKNNKVRMDAIIDRAKRRGKLGWNVGTNEIFTESHALVSREKSEGTGRQLTYSHIRGGHPHAVRYGEGKNKIKIKWFRSTQVREDLPFKKE